MSWYDNGMPIIDDPEVLATAELIKRLYATPGGANGGPLHVIVEDGNTEDEHVHDNDYFGRSDGRTVETYLCKRGEGTWTGSVYHHAYLDELYCSEELADLSRLILASFRRMPEPWRAAAIAWADGTAWAHLERLAGEPLIGGAPFATPEQVDALIAELRQAEDAPAGPKACTPVPCPSFEEFNPAAEMNASGHTGRSPDWRDVAWAAYPNSLLARAVAELATQGECTFTTCNPTLCTEDHEHRPTLRWAEMAAQDFDGTYRRWRLFVDEPPQVDARRDLADPRQVQPVYSTDAILGMAEPWAGPIAAGVFANPTPQAPLFVGLPAGVEAGQLAEAIRLCQQAGLIPDTPNGVVYIPGELGL